MYLLTICVSSLEKMSIRICCSLFNWIVLVFSVELHEFLCILDVNSLSDVMICKYFLLFGRLVFSFCCAECSSAVFAVVPLISFCFYCLWCQVKKKNHHQDPYQMMISHHMFQVFNQFWVHLCLWWKITVQFNSFMCGCPVSPVPFIKETVLSPIIYSGLLCCKLTNHICMDLFMDFLIYFIHLCVFLCQHHTVLITVALWYGLKSGNMMLQLHSYFSKLLWLFEVFCGSI